MAEKDYEEDVKGRRRLEPTAASAKADAMRHR